MTAVMAELLGAFGKAISSFLELKQVSIDNWVFKLFYKVTTSLLLICSVLCTFKYGPSVFFPV